MSFMMPKPGKRYSPPAGDYKMGGKNPSRFIGTDINGEVYQVGNSRHSDKAKYEENYDRTFRKK